MELKGLMFGNIVAMGVHNIPVIIREMDCNGITYDRVDGTEVIGHCEWEHLHPIPLTEDILLKSGFKKTTIPNPFFSIYDIYLGRNRMLSVGQPGSPNEMIPIVDYSEFEHGSSIIIKNYDYDGKTYLHQLQNLYYFLTGKELECNL